MRQIVREALHVFARLLLEPVDLDDLGELATGPDLTAPLRVAGLFQESARATGLEPATSGVTGRAREHHGRLLPTMSPACRHGSRAIWRPSSAR